MPSAFDQAFAAVVGVEGGFSAAPSDPGNWTGGAVGKGALHGTKHGISAASYPNKDIANLTLEQSKAIYLTDFWAKVRADALPPPLALLVFDAAVNDGPGRAARWLQAAAGVTQDGAIGPETLAAVGRRSLLALLVEFHAQRSLWQLTLSTAKTFGRGWARRLVTVLLAAQAMEGCSTTQPAQAPPVQPTAPIQPTPPVKPVTDETAVTEALNASESLLVAALNTRTQ